MKRLSPISLFILVSSCIGATDFGPQVIHESRDLENIEWVRKNRVGPGVWLPVRIALKQNERAMEMAHDWLMDVSHPESPNYGQHWSLDRVIETFQPSDKTVQAVTQWLTETGLIERHRITHSDNKAWLAFDIPAAAAEKLLKTEYYEYSHTASGRIEISCDQYYIPEALQKHIDYVKPGLKGIQISQEVSKRAFKQAPNSTPGFPSPYRYTPPKDPLSLSVCDHVTTPACIRALYQFEPHDPSAIVSPNNTMGIYEAGNYLVQEDLDLFFSTFAPHIPKGTHPTLDLVDSGSATDIKQFESNMDFSIAYSIIYPQNTTLYQVNDFWYNQHLKYSTGQASFNTFLDAIDGSYCTYSAYNETGDDPKIDPIYPDPHGNATTGYHGKLMCGVYKPTNVVSVSYGGDEIGYYGYFPAFYEKRQCNEFLKLALQGVTMIFASGDYGVPCFPTGRGLVFGATTPSNCPYVTSVGATEIARGNSVYEPEVVAYQPLAGGYEIYSSAGGFSNIYPRPEYQEKALSNYFANHAPPYPYYENGDYKNSTGIYNRNGRGHPDVAANGLRLPVYNSSIYSNGGGGTSASAPIFASLINRINEERIKHGKGRVGFVNPALYEHPEVLNDITQGHNVACGQDQGPGFYAVPGWDPVTGLGTPNYPKMLELFLSLP